jgi:CheY-like chemotaxis protein
LFGCKLVWKIGNEMEVQMGPDKILVVDDQPEFVELLRLQLGLIGWEATTAGSGREALEKLRDMRPTVILLDMWMPGMSGLELARLLKNDPQYRAIPILAFSAAATDADRQQCLEAGCDDYISKPFTNQELEKRIVRLIPKILVVDDQPEFLELLAVQLGLIGCEAIFAGSGGEALEKLRDVRPAAILLDVRMPGMSGPELARLLKNDPDRQGIPILALSAFAMDRDRQQCLEAGCDDYISKPFTIQELEERVLRLLSRKDLAQHESSLDKFQTDT